MSAVNSALNRLLQKADELRGDHRDPVAVDKLCSRFGLELKCEPTLQGDGRLIKRTDGSMYIAIKHHGTADRLPPHYRFTVAHELGHFVLLTQPGFEVRPDSDAEYFEIEKLCNRFAGSLLVHTALFDKRQWSDAYRVCAQIVKVASMCKVSLEVATRECIYNGLEAIVGCSGVNMNGILSIEWGFCSFGKIAETRGRFLRGRSCTEGLQDWARTTLNRTIVEPEIDAAQVTIKGKKKLSCTVRKRQTS
jgi:hypothetical protein